MAGTRLFVINEAGSASFCTPLWRMWLNTPPPFEWNIIASPSALGVIRKNFGGGAPLIAEWGIIPDLRDVELIISSATGAAFEGVMSEQKIPFVQFLDTIYGVEKRLTPNLDTLLVIHESVVDKAQDLAKYIRIIGHPVWEETSNHPVLKGNDSIFTFASQPISQISALGALGYNEHIVWDMLCQAQKAAPERIKELVYLPHPSQENIPAMGAHQRVVGNDENPLSVGGTMFGMYTALMVDAYLSGQNVISVQPNLAGADHCILSVLGLIPLVTSDEPVDVLKAEPMKAKDGDLITVGSLARFAKICG